MGDQEFLVTISYKYNIDMDAVADDYGTDNPWEMAAIDRVNLAGSPKMLTEDFSDQPYKVSVQPLEGAREPVLIRHREQLLRDAARWQRTYLSMHPEATMEDLIAVLDPDKKASW